MNLVGSIFPTTWLRCIVYGVFLVAVPAASVLGLPRGYKEDFNGCSANSETEQERKDCCSKTLGDCVAQCKTDHGRSGQKSIVCRAECIVASGTCDLGQQVAAGVEWPEHPGHDVPWIREKDNSLVPQRGVQLKRSDRSVVIEMRGDKAHAELAECLAVVATCECPPSQQSHGDDAPVCRPVVEPDRAVCQVCNAVSGSEKCEPCAECTPVVLSVQGCEPAERRGDTPGKSPSAGGR